MDLRSRGDGLIRPISQRNHPPPPLPPPPPPPPPPWFIFFPQAVSHSFLQVSFFSFFFLPVRFFSA